MKLRTLPLLCTLALASVGPSARASLIGDTITITTFYDNLGSASHLLLGTPTVVSGTGDVVSQLPYYSVNPEATSINVSFLSSGTFATATFNGMWVAGIDDTITGVSVATNLVGWNNSQLTFDAHSIHANWSGVSFTTSSYFNVTLNPTPDGGDSAILLGCALLGLRAWRRIIPA